MKASSATSARATPPRPTGRSSAKPRPTLTSAEFALSGPTNAPDPTVNAYRKDLADVALAGRVIASHYAAPVDRVLVRAAALRDGPSADAAEIAELEPGAAFLMLDDSTGWAWGYAGERRRVGYLPADALAATG